MNPASLPPVHIHNSVTQPQAFPFTPQRLPDSLTPEINPGAGNNMRLAANTEIRFRMEAGSSVRVILHAEKHTAVSVYHGDYQGPTAHVIRPGETVEVPIEISPRHTKALQHGILPRVRFAPELVRVCMMGHLVTIVDLQGDGLSPPQPGDVPSRRLLCCGSSITHGFCASMPQATYPARLGHLLGMDTLNLGLSGTFHAEPGLADYLAQRNDWDVATIELSANMASTDNDTFYQRAKYFTHRLAIENPKRHVFAVSLFPQIRDLPHHDPELDVELGLDKRRLLKQAVLDNNLPNLHFCSGPDMMPAFDGISQDLIHIGDDGFAQIAANLARQVKSVLGG